MRRALVIGLGLSGLAAAELLLRDGYEVVGVDRHSINVASSLAARRLIELGLIVLEEREIQEISPFSLVIVSPGVAPDHPLYHKALKSGVETIGEAEFGLRRMHQPCIAITGTNGKTTVTLLIEHILQSAGKKAKALGNVGSPLSEYFLAPDEEEIIVAELSSYQLETLKSPVVDVGVILNITPDHLDRYKTVREYASAKCRLQFCIKPQGAFYVHADVLRTYGDLLPQGRCMTFSDDLYQNPHSSSCFGIEEVPGTAIHDRENAIAVWLLTRPFGVSYEQFIQAVKTFRKPPHRIEYIANINGVDYYDDSKGTNIDAVIKAVEAMPGPVVLLAGGVDKGASYRAWQVPFTGKVKQIYVFGQARERIAAETSAFCQVEIVDNLQQAVRAAMASAKKGECVLLSPGCASLDMFRDYAHRGEEFRRYLYQKEGAE